MNLKCVETQRKSRRKTSRNPENLPMKTTLKYYESGGNQRVLDQDFCTVLSVKQKFKVKALWRTPLCVGSWTMHLPVSNGSRQIWSWMLGRRSEVGGVKVTRGWGCWLIKPWCYDPDGWHQIGSRTLLSKVHLCIGTRVFGDGSQKLRHDDEKNIYAKIKIKRPRSVIQTVQEP